MIKMIDIHNKKIALELFNLQKAAYQIEAELIQFFDIPPLIESLEDLIASEETFLGYFEGEELAGAISYTVDGNELEICRMIVHPKHFRKGIAQKLLHNLEERNKEKTVFKVATGKDNTPAKQLYCKNDYKLVGDLEVEPGFFISQYEKRSG